MLYVRRDGHTFHHHLRTSCFARLSVLTFLWGSQFSPYRLWCRNIPVRAPRTWSCSDLEASTLSLSAELLPSSLWWSRYISVSFRTSAARLVSTNQQTNGLEKHAKKKQMMKRLMELKKEKEDLALEVEREEELLTNTLQKKLNQVHGAARRGKETGDAVEACFSWS